MALAAVALKDLGWEYGERAYKRCRLLGTKIPKGGCSRVQDAVETAFDTMVQSIYIYMLHLSFLARAADQGDVLQGVNLADVFNVSTRDADTFGRSDAFKKNMVPFNRIQSSNIILSSL